MKPSLPIQVKEPVPTSLRPANSVLNRPLGRSQREWIHTRNATLSNLGEAPDRALDAELLSEINDRLSSRKFQASLRSRNLARAELQINEVLSLYQESRWLQQQATRLALPAEHGRQRSAHVLYGHVQSFFTLCLQQKKLAAALNCARILPPTPSLFTALLKACLDHGDFYAVSQAVEVRKDVGIPEDAFCYTALLKAAAREHNPARTDALFRKAWEIGIRGAPIFNALIGQHNAVGQIRESFATFDRMLRLGVEPDVVTMNLLIKAAGTAGRLNVVEQLYGQMLNIGPQPTSITFVHLFSACDNSQRKDYAWLHQVYEDMLALGIPPVTQHFVTLLGACCDMPMSAREIRQVYSRAMAFCAAQGGDCSVYAALLKFCVSQGIPEKAVDVWKAIQKAKHKVDSWVYAAMFTACAAYKSPEHCMILTQAYHSLQSHYKEAKTKRILSTAEQRGQRIAFNALLNACAKTGMIKAAEELLQSMQADGPLPDIISYNTLISGHAQAANTSGAFDTFYKLCEASSQATASAFRLRPNSRTFGAMLHTCARAGNADSAKKVLELMRRAGVSPTAEAYTSLMNACIKQGSSENIAYAFEIFEAMKAEGVIPSAVTYGCLMNGCEMRGEIDQAVKLYVEACDQGIFPSDECHNTLLNMFAKNNRLEEVLEVVQSLARQRSRGFQGAALNSLARALAPEYVEKAITVLAILKKQGLRVHRDTYVALIQACTQESLIDTAHDLYWILSNEGAVASQEAGSRLIMALCRANQVESALAVYDDMVLASSASPRAPANSAAISHSQTIEGHSPQSGKASPNSETVSSEAGQGSKRLSTRSGGAITAEYCSDPMSDLANPDEPPQAFNLTAADRLGLRRSIICKDGWAADSGGHSKQSSGKRSRRHKGAVFPHSRAMAALVQAFCYQDLDKAFDLYSQLQQDSAGAAAVTLSDRFMWQSLIEAACRKSQLDRALQVYDDWKVYCATQEALHRFADDVYAHIPRLSNVTLAFLEACCRAEANRAAGEEADRFSLRVYDVCATMRQQQDRKVQATLPRPRKASHHFADS